MNKSRLSSDVEYSRKLMLNEWERIYKILLKQGEELQILENKLLSKDNAFRSLLRTYAKHIGVIVSKKRDIEIEEDCIKRLREQIKQKGSDEK